MSQSHPIRRSREDLEAAFRASPLLHLGRSISIDENGNETPAPDLPKQPPAPRLQPIRYCAVPPCLRRKTGNRGPCKSRYIPAFASSHRKLSRPMRSTGNYCRYIASCRNRVGVGFSLAHLQPLPTSAAKLSVESLEPPLQADHPSSYLPTSSRIFMSEQDALEPNPCLPLPSYFHPHPFSAPRLSSSYPFRDFTISPGILYNHSLSTHTHLLIPLPPNLPSIPNSYNINVRRGKAVMVGKEVFHQMKAVLDEKMESWFVVAHKFEFMPATLGVRQRYGPMKGEVAEVGWWLEIVFQIRRQWGS